MEVKEKQVRKLKIKLCNNCAQRNYDTRRSIVDGAREWLFEMLEEMNQQKVL